MRCTSTRTLRALLAFALVSHALAQSPTLVDATPLGGAASSGARDASLSADGRWIAFVSDSSDLVVADSNAAADVFLCSRDTGLIVRASLASGGTETHPSTSTSGFPGVACPAVSRDGRFVAFVSNAADLVAGDTNNACDVFVRDVVAGTTERVSVATDGTQGSTDSGAFSWQSGIPAVQSAIASGIGITSQAPPR